MSDKPQSEVKEKEEEGLAPGVTPVAVEIKNEVRTKVNAEQNNGAIRNRVIHALSEIEIKRRQEILTKALAKRDEVAKELEKMHPDIKHYDEDGQEAGKYFSAEKMKARKNLVKQLGKIDKAINRAVNDADYEGLKKIG